MDNGYGAKAESYRIRINEIMEKLKHIK